MLPSLGGLIWIILAFIVALSVIVAIHEYGHYIVGRWSGIHAEVFSLGFGPRLISRVDRRGTVWQVALLPLGGYVRFKGDADAASANADGEAIAEMTPEERRQTMAGAPLWARTATVAAGPVFNFISAIIIFFAMDMVQGVVSEPLTVGRIHPMPQQIELREGDEILGINGMAIPEYYDGQFNGLVRDLPVQDRLDYAIRRDGTEMVVKGPFPLVARIEGLVPQSAAADIDLKVGDVITAANGAPVNALRDVQDVVIAVQGAPVLLDVWRDGEMLKFTLAPRKVDEPDPAGGFRTKWRMGIYGGLFFEPETTTPGIGSALWMGVSNVWYIISGSFSGLWHMITGAISTCNMSGPVGIAQVSGQMASQGAGSFLQFIGVLSVAVGMLNLFPVPVLDGGHLAFYAYEAVAGRPPSETALRILTSIGLFLVLGLMLFALFNDLFC